MYHSSGSDRVEQKRHGSWQSCGTARGLPQQQAARPGPLQPACVIVLRCRAESLIKRQENSTAVFLQSFGSRKRFGMISWPKLIPRKIENIWIYECEPDSQSRQSAKY